MNLIIKICIYKKIAHLYIAMVKGITQILKKW